MRNTQGFPPDPLYLMSKVNVASGADAGRGRYLY